MIIFAVIFALLLNKINDSRIASKDTVISVFSSTAIALGLVLLTKNGNYTEISNYLIGDILNIIPSEIGFLIIVGLVVLAFWLFGFNKLLGISVNTTLAKSKRIPVKLIENIFVILVAIIVMISIKWIGILIINSLLILPAAASRNISKNMRQYIFCSGRNIRFGNFLLSRNFNRPNNCIGFKRDLFCHVFYEKIVGRLDIRAIL